MNRSYGESSDSSMDCPRLDSMEKPCYSLHMAERYTAMVNAWSPSKWGTGPSRVFVTLHAIERCQQRVAPDLTIDEIRALLLTMVSSGRVRTTPRKWTKGSVSLTPGLRFVYWSELPDVCGLVRDGTLVTVVTRTTCRRPLPTNLPFSDYLQRKHRQSFIHEGQSSRESVENAV